MTSAARRRREASYRHGTRVRVGGARGVLLHCEKRDGSRFWKIRLQGGEWIWPDDFAVDGPGDELAPACGRCELPFYRRAGSDELLCVRCDLEQFGSREDRDRDARDGPYTRSQFRRR